jgi:septin family protein
MVGASFVFWASGRTNALTHAHTPPVENEKYCEFAALRKFLMATHLQELIDTTSQVHYEAFRTRQLLALKESAGAQRQQAASQQ